MFRVTGDTQKKLRNTTPAGITVHSGKSHVSSKYDIYKHSVVLDEITNTIHKFVILQSMYTEYSQSTQEILFLLSLIHI